MSAAAVDQALRTAEWRVRSGRVSRVSGLLIESDGPPVRVGDLCRVGDGLAGEVVGFRGRSVLLMPFGSVHGVELGARVTATPGLAAVAVGPHWLGRVVDGLGRPLDDHHLSSSGTLCPLYPPALNPLVRADEVAPFLTGVRAIDVLLPLARGQRIGIFAGSGVGKSTLLEMLATRADADVHVVALIGERGREAHAFVKKLRAGPAWDRTVVIVSTSDEPPLLRRRAAFVATAVAEYFCDAGKQVCLTLDSATRLAMAQREIGLSAGELPTARGYTPSVFELLPRLLERGGTRAAGGSITGLYSVLVEGDDLNDPVADSLRAILDGHFVLSRDIAQRGRYPAIDVPRSISRLAPRVQTPEQAKAARSAVSLLAAYDEARDLIEVGAYRSGSNPRVDRAVQCHDGLEAFLAQGPGEVASPSAALAALQTVLTGTEPNHG